MKLWGPGPVRDPRDVTDRAVAEDHVVEGAAIRQRGPHIGEATASG